MGAPGGTGSVLTFEPARVGRLFRSGRSGRGRAPAGGGCRARRGRTPQSRQKLRRSDGPRARRGRDPLRSRGAIVCPAGGRKLFQKKFLRTRSVSVYTSSRSSEAIRTAAWGVSSVWLERRPVTSEVAGSSPVLPAIANKALPCAGLFAIERACRRGCRMLGRRLAHVPGPCGPVSPFGSGTAMPASGLRPLPPRTSRHRRARGRPRSAPAPHVPASANGQYS